MAFDRTHEPCDASRRRDSATEGVHTARSWPCRKVELVRQQLKTLRPTWSATDLGAALVAVAGELDAAGDVQQSAAEPQLIVVSDFQKGARTEALQAYEWPKRVRLIAREVRPKQTTNAYAHLLTSEADEERRELRVRVVNSRRLVGRPVLRSLGGSRRARSGPSQRRPPSMSRRGRAAWSSCRGRPSALLADRVVLRGDDHEFDNTHFVVPPRKQQVQLVYAGSDAADDAQGMQYYLRLATGGDPLRQVEFMPLEGDDAQAAAADAAAASWRSSRGRSPPRWPAELKSFAEQGGMVRPRAAGSGRGRGDSAALGRRGAAAGASREDAADEDKFLLLGEIDFTHPLFAPFAGPRYSDFTKIHFWRQRSPEAEAGRARRTSSPASTTAHPAIARAGARQGPRAGLRQRLEPRRQPAGPVEQVRAAGRRHARPGLRNDGATGRRQPSISAVPLAVAPRSAAIVHKPDGKDVKLPAEAAQLHRRPTSRASTGRSFAAEEARFAVNLAAGESNTAPLEMEQLEQLGVRLSASLTRAERLSQIRQQRDTELESRQKLWRWIIVGALGVLVLETWWAGRAARQIAHSDATAAESKSAADGPSGDSHESAATLVRARPGGLAVPACSGSGWRWRRPGCVGRAGGPGVCGARGELGVAGRAWRCCWSAWSRRGLAVAGIWLAATRPATTAGSRGGSRRRFPSCGPACWRRSSSGPTCPAAVSAICRSNVIHQALYHADRNAWTEVVPTKRIAWRPCGQRRRRSRCSSASLALVALSAGPAAGTRPLLANAAAAVTPGKSFTVTVEPGNTEVERGTSLLVLARVTGAMPAEATLVFRTEAGEESRLPMSPSLDDPVFGGRIPRRRCSRSTTTSSWAARPRPRTASPCSNIRGWRGPTRSWSIPAYTKLPEKLVQDVRTVSVVEGTELTLMCYLNKAVATATLDRGPAAADRDDGSHAACAAVRRRPIRSQALAATQYFDTAQIQCDRTRQAEAGAGR